MTNSVILGETIQA